MQVAVAAHRPGRCGPWPDQRRCSGARRWVLPLPVPGAAGRALATGGLLLDGPHDTGRRTFAEHLAAGRP